MQSTLPLDDRSVPITLPPDVVAAIDIWIAVQPDPKPSRDAMVGYVMREWLTCMGLLPPQQAPRVVN